MQKTQTQPKVNPLAGLMRQPKLYIKLPSAGKFWSNGSLVSAPNGEYAVYSMTAKDELLLRNPATQVGGQALVDVVKSCIPDIKNAWKAPGIDLDTILIAIRIATYGSNMKVPYSYEGIQAEVTIDLQEVLKEILETVEWQEQIALSNGMIVFIRPLAYESIALAGQESTETQKIISIVNDEKLSEEDKVEKFKKSFMKLTDITLNVVVKSIEKIITVDNVEVTDPQFIYEFMEQCDREVFAEIRAKVAELTQKNSLKPIFLPATPAMKEAGSPDMIETPITFTPDNFFA
jgi:hypothetical protein